MLIVGFGAGSTPELSTFYDFDDSSFPLNDKSGNNNDATVFNQSLLTTSGQGQFGDSIYFASEGYAKPDVSQLPQSGSYAISTWVKWNYAAQTKGTILIWGEPSTNSAVGLALQNPSNSNTGDYAVRATLWGNDVDASFDYTDEEWHHYVVSYNDSSGNMKIYADNSLLKTESVNPSIGSSDAWIGLNGFAPYPTGSIEANLDQMRIYNDHLNSTEVSNLYSYDNPTGFSGPSNSAPTASFTTFSNGLEVDVDASGSSDSDGSISSYEWDWNSDGTYESTGVTASHNYVSPGSYNITLRVTDDDGATDTQKKEVSVTDVSGSCGSLKIHYTFNGSATDLSGCGNDGQLLNGANISNNTLDTTSPEAILRGPDIAVRDDFTVAMRAKLPSTSQALGTFVSNGFDGATGFEYRFDTSGAAYPLRFQTYDGSNSFGALWNQDLITGSWYNLSGSCSNGEWNIYKNGVQVASSSETACASDTSSSFTVGGLRDSTVPEYKNFLNATFDTVYIYNESLSQSEIQNLDYTSEGSGSGTTDSDPFVSIISPESNEEVSEPYEINVSVSDDFEVSEVRLYSDYSGSMVQEQSKSVSISNGYVQFEVDTSGFGTHNFYAEAVDNASKTTSSSTKKVQVTDAKIGNFTSVAQVITGDMVTVPSYFDTVNPKEPAAFYSESTGCYYLEMTLWDSYEGFGAVDHMRNVLFRSCTSPTSGYTHISNVTGTQSIKQHASAIWIEDGKIYIPYSVNDNGNTYISVRYSDLNNIPSQASGWNECTPSSLDGYRDPGIVKNGSTYYMFATTPNPDATIDKFTTNDSSLCSWNLATDNAYDDANRANEGGDIVPLSDGSTALVTIAGSSAFDQTTPALYEIAGFAPNLESNEWDLGSDFETGQPWLNVSEVGPGDINGIQKPFYSQWAGHFDYMYNQGSLNLYNQSDTGYAFFEAGSGSEFSIGVAEFQADFKYREPQGPSVNVISPKNQTYSSSSVDLNVTSSEPSSTTNWRYSLDGAANTSFAPNTSISVDEGSHTLNVYADYSDGSVLKDSVSFTYRDATSSVTIGKGVEIYQPDNNAKIAVNQSLNVSSLRTFSDTTSFGGVNFSIINPAGDPVDVFLSYFDENAVEPEYVANYSANTADGNEVTFQFDGLAENSLYKASMNGDMFESGETGSNGNFSFSNSMWPSLQDFSVQNFDNLAPTLGKPFYREDRKQGIQRLVFSVDDRGEDDIDSLRGPGTSVVSSNSTLGVSVDLPVSGVYNVSDIYGAVSNTRSVELSKIDSGLREHDYGHTLDVQRLNRTVELVNNDDEDLDYNLTLENHGSTVVQEGSWSGSIPASGSVVNTGIWEDDYIVDEIVDMVQKGPDQSFDHTENQQQLKNRTRLVVNNQGEVAFSSVDLSSYCDNTQSAEIPVGSEVVVTSNCTSEVKTGQFIQVSTSDFSQDATYSSDLDSQGLVRTKSLTETRGYNWSQVNVSAPSLPGDCVNCGERVFNISADSTETEFYNSTGDWIVNVSNETTSFASGSVVIGEAIDQNFTAVQRINASNARESVDLSANFSSRISKFEHCAVGDTVRTVAANSSSSFEFIKECESGQLLSQEPVQKMETADYYKYTYKASFEVFTNLSDEEPQEFAVKKTRLSNFESRSPNQTEAYIDDRSSGLSVSQEFIQGEEYVLVGVPDDFGNSSLHKGNHSVELVYFEDKSSGGGSDDGSSDPGGGGVIIGGGDSGEPELVENVTGKYNWTLSTVTSEDTQRFTVVRSPGDSFEKEILLRNEGDSEVPLNLSCVSEAGYCGNVDLSVDRVILNTGSFNQKQVTVTGNIPANASSGSSYTFRILVEDPSSTGLGSEGAATVDFLVTVSDFFGGIVSYANKLTEWRELESPFGIGNPIPYPFALLPLLSAAVVGVAVLGIRRLLEVESSALVQASHFGLIVLTFLVSVPLWP